jgi:hypothetical protein
MKFLAASHTKIPFPTHFVLVYHASGAQCEVISDFDGGQQRKAEKEASNPSE